MTTLPPEHDGGLVILRVDEARLIVHTLAAFERVLRHAGLTEDQAALLLPDGAGPADPQADAVMAEIVSECADLLQRQIS
jgi:hypothetical protein